MEQQKYGNDKSRSIKDSKSKKPSDKDGKRSSEQTFQRDDRKDASTKDASHPGWKR